MESLKQEFKKVLKEISFEEFKKHCKENDISTSQIKRDELESLCNQKFEACFFTKRRYQEIFQQKGGHSYWTKKELVDLCKSKKEDIVLAQSKNSVELLDVFYNIVLGKVKSTTPIGGKTLSGFKYSDWIIPDDEQTVVAKLVALDESSEFPVAEAKILKSKKEEEPEGKKSLEAYFKSSSKKEEKANVTETKKVEEKSIKLPKVKTYEKAVVEVSEEKTKCSEDKKYQIPKKVKTDVWNTYIGQNIPQHKCLCCKLVLISITAFDVGHVLSEKNGGTSTINNLRPICSSCNTSMGCRDMREYVLTYGYLI